MTLTLKYKIWEWLKHESFLSEQDWVAFMSQPYWVEVKVEVDIKDEVDNEAEVDLRLKWCWDEVGSKFSWNWVKLGMRQVNVELRKNNIGLGLWFKICSTHIAEHMFSMSRSFLAFNLI